MSNTEDCVLRMKGISKEYFGTRVLKNIDLEIRPGEVHGIVGENGAGKSTLMNILFGMTVIHSTGGYEGKIEIAGALADIRSPFDAMNLGIGMVHQEFMLIPGFTITENIKLNRETTRENPVSRVFGPRFRTLDMASMRKDARKALDHLEMGIDEWVRVAGLPVGHMQFIEIAREIDKNGIRLLVFDEPTAVLAESEADNLLAAIRKLAASGIAVLFITHRLHEVLSVCDNVTVLRDGNLVARLPRQEATLEDLARLMVGRSLGEMIRQPAQTLPDRKVMEIRNLHVRMPGESAQGVDLDVREGEILGIAGLAGQGKIGIANGIMGLYPATGDVQFKGEPLPLNSTREALQRGLAFLSEDRRGVGLLLDLSLEMNIASTAMEIHGKFLRRLGPFTQIDGKAMKAHALDMIKALDIRCKGPLQPVRRLSGGNQQKVCIAKALVLHPRLLFVSEPTRGIDVGAKRLVLETLVDLKERLGMTIVMTSSELAELRSVCDRIAIVHGGKIAGILPPDAEDADFGLMMAGDYGKL
ncbi:MAG TPA: sugar ABC transporter ATP-binding protein [Magnetospirillaceae bacterium]|nr:sugar ABC transporter ATP-binding protein [Magnetospirillaceae bacterium]